MSSRRYRLRDAGVRAPWPLIFQAGLSTLRGLLCRSSSHRTIGTVGIFLLEVEYSVAANLLYVLSFGTFVKVPRRVPRSSPQGGVELDVAGNRVQPSIPKGGMVAVALCHPRFAPRRLQSRDRLTDDKDDRPFHRGQAATVAAILRGSGRRLKIRRRLKPAPQFSSTIYRNASITSSRADFGGRVFDCGECRLGVYHVQ